ncbi:monofunctional biosynthetic peptidoglycan transglycosylase [bacterium]|nr:monofunctional biosynthetic peptidoglycan transglycosylase [bacterium]
MTTFIKLWISLVLILIVGFLMWFPSEQEIKGCMTTSMFDVELCPKSKNYVPLSQISRNMQNALILTEDSSFYQHNGFDEEGIQRCFEKLKEKMRIVCGGSTITQQLAKNMFLSRNKNFIRKGVEALITFKLEQTLTKREILEKYLNVVQFGKNIFGIKAAAQFYFKKHPSQLTVNESAFLAMVLPNPEKYSQSFFRKDLTRFARKRVNRIIKNMYRFGRIDAGSYSNASGSVDSFLKSGQAAPPRPPEHEESLSKDDLNEMDEPDTDNED